MAMRENAELASPRMQKFVVGIMAGKSQRAAALDAGYAEATANQAYRALMPRARELFGTMLQEHIPLERQTRLLAEGMEANTTKFFAEKGIVTDEREMVDWTARHNFQRLAAQIQGLLPERMEVTGADGEPLKMNVDIRLAHFGELTVKPDDPQTNP